MLLARTVAHTTDVDAMLATMTPREFAEWVIMYNIRPWGIELPIDGEEQQTASLDAFRSMAGF